jgi:hypothetical protein
MEREREREREREKKRGRERAYRYSFCMLGAHQQGNQVNQHDVLDFLLDLVTWTQLNKEIK